MGPAVTKLNVGILFGGQSAEHEISVLSARNVVAALDRQRFEPVLIGIDKTGKWHLDKTGKILAKNAVDENEDDGVTLVSGPSQNLISTESGAVIIKLDVVFPILHGPKGEDGSVQGLLELANLPYVGPGIAGSAVSMDKDFSKRLLRDAGLQIADFIVMTAADNLAPDAIISKLGLPLFVKPANMGSSVGVSKVNNLSELLPALRQAFNYDTKILIESAVLGDEIECAVLGNDKPAASIVGRIRPKRDFYSYAAKYIDENGAALEIPAQIADEVTHRARDIAIQAYRALDLNGMSRVDMFARSDGSIVVNEINTIPGFTSISMYPKLWEATGISYSDLITRLIDLALERFRRREQLATTYAGHIK